MHGPGERPGANARLRGGRSCATAPANGAERLLKRVGLGERKSHRPGELSGGERQRVAVVRALINQPQLLLADEPTGSLDHASAQQLGQLLLELNREEGVTLIVVTHARELARRMGRVLELKDGRLVPASNRKVRPRCRQCRSRERHVRVLAEQSNAYMAPRSLDCPGSLSICGARAPSQLDLLEPERLTVSAASMTFWTLIRRSLRFHARAHLGVVLGAAIGSAALIGALVVGDSVRESLTNMALRRLGKSTSPSPRRIAFSRPAWRQRLSRIRPPDPIRVGSTPLPIFSPSLPGRIPRRWRFPASLPGRTAPRAPTVLMCSAW